MELHSGATILDKKEAPHLGLPFLGITASCCLFLVLNKVAKDANSPSFIKPDVWSSWKFRNLFISWIHAIIVGTWVILCLVDGEMFEDLIAHYNYLNYFLVVFSTGYFIYDTIDIFVSNQVPNQKEVLIHHAAVLSIFILNLITNTSVAYTIVALMVEVNSVFLHLRKLLQYNGVNYNSKFYLFNCYVNLVTFVLFRFTALAGIWYGVIMWADRFETLYYIVLISTNVAMIPINLILFWKLFKSDVLRKLNSKKTKKTDTALENHANNNLKPS